MDTQNGTVGGGEILQYWNQSSTRDSKMDESLISQFMMLPWVRILIIVLLIIAAFLLIMKVLKVRNPFRGKTVVRELNHMTNVRKHDEAIIRANKMIRIATNIVEKSPFAMNKLNIEYWAYNLTRADVRIPGGARVMQPEEFNAIVKIITFLVCVIGVVLAIFINIALGTLICLLAIIFSSTMPLTFVRTTVRKKDAEIINNFADFYLMIHYVLLANASTPISGIMKSYDKTTNSDEMHRFVNICIHYIDTYGEFEATHHIAKVYREIPEVGKLMRLIRQANEGGDVRAELMGFRNELLEAKKYAIEKRMNKLINRAKASFNILMPILVQAIISAMAIYLEDLKGVTSFL